MNIGGGAYVWYVNDILLLDGVNMVLTPKSWTRSNVTS
jgi:hypothetical protein